MSTFHTTISRRMYIAAVLCLISLSGCSTGSSEGLTIQAVDHLTLYEGLPHQFYEADKLDSEKKSKPTIDIHGFPFYRETLELKAEDEKSLRAELGSEKSYAPYSGEKKCGGFHPDYAVKWSVAKKTSVCLICFGCGEFRVYGPQGEQYFDISAGARERLQALLSPYVKNRPPHERFGP